MTVVGYFNGRFLDIETPALPLEDRGALFGDGVYEVVRVYAGQPFLFSEHWARFQRSAEAVRLPVPHTFQEWSEIVAEGIRKSNLSEALVYFHLTRGGGARQHAFPTGPGHMVMTVRPARDAPLAERERGVKLCTLPDDRWANVYIKSLNLLPNVLAKQTALDKGCQEALYVRNGFVTEGSASNVFCVRNGKLLTPPADRHILGGITRQAVLRVAQAANVAVEERPIGESEILQSSEVFLTSTSLEVMPVSQIDSHRFPVAHSSLTWALWVAFCELAGKNCG